MHYLKEDAKNLVIKELLYFGLELLNLGCLLVKYERCNKTPYFKKTLPARPYCILYPIHSAWCQVIISFYITPQKSSSGSRAHSVCFACVAGLRMLV